MIQIFKLGEKLRKDTHKYTIFLNDANKGTDFYQFIYIAGAPMETTETQTGDPWFPL